MFSAFFELCVKERKSPSNPEAIIKSLQNLQAKLHVAAGQIRSEPRQQNVDVTLGLIRKHFENKDPPVLEHGMGSAIPFENAISRSRLETSAYECKQGLLRLDNKREQEPELLSRIVETICGIANIAPDTEGAVFIGIADKKADKDRIEDLDKTIAAHVSARFIVGVDREVKLQGITLEQYKRRIVEHIASSGLSEPLKSAVLSKIDCITYRGHSVICMWVPMQKSYSSVNDRVFIREGSSTKEAVGASALHAIFQRFQR